MYYYEIIKESVAYKDVYKEREMELHWNSEEINKKICDFLGVESIDKNLYLTGKVLMMANPPEHIKEQFKKPEDGIYNAKKNSIINKRWIEFCKENNLRRFDAWWVLTRDHDMLGVGGKKSLVFINDRYFIISEFKIERDFLKEITEEEYLKIRLDYLEKRKMQS